MRGIAGSALMTLLFVGCQTAGWDNRDALAAQSIEWQLDARGQTREIEYHIAPEQVPPVVREAMDSLHPGGAYTGAEKEMNDGVLYYELTRKVSGMDVEAMFLPDGTLYQEEIQVAARKVPGNVRAAAMQAVSGAQVTKWEEIRDSNRVLFQYHVKMRRGSVKYKVILSTSGKHQATYREIPAEIEVDAG